MRNLLLGFIVLVCISCNTLGDWRVVTVVEPNPSDELIKEYNIKVGSVGGPYTLLVTLPASGAMYFVQTHTSGTGPFGYVMSAVNALDLEGPNSPEQVATEPDPPPTIPGPTSPALSVIILGQ